MEKILKKYRDPEISRELVERISFYKGLKVNIMEVCGGHTMAIHKHGIPRLLPEGVKMHSGPGCPVCVSEQSFIDRVMDCACMPDTILCCYGDLMRVPGSHGSLISLRSKGYGISVVVSPLQALEKARKNPEKTVIFAGIGFETTTPGTAATILKAYNEKTENFLILSGHKIMPPALHTIMKNNNRINALLAPGHVAAIAGVSMFQRLSYQYKIPVVVSGFEPVDILLSIVMILKQLDEGRAETELQYKRVVKNEGNIQAQRIMNEVFEPTDVEWRGIGMIKASGLKLNKKYRLFDAEKILHFVKYQSVTNRGCICGAVLRGESHPENCEYFGSKCKPDHPLGACMVSSEGACAAFYHYS